MQILFEVKAFEEYHDWARIDKKVFQRISKLIIEITRDPFNGIGKPEPLKHELSGCWSRRIDDVHRLVYVVEEDVLRIISCKNHY
ncbi:Txe/YoeB family addiction module toxin [Thioflexithrix psekupsensis]|uniref:Putative mRNA interferase YoeB n=1 Tax=Thioflexithrix psekupsensis TaxID=1570016 RepID=A0A251XA74_9GAMM|nr:Txe/YoeB family addiction module toxin [Thioflexithrix psekupsensis]OUD14583.1 toxin YoeB [Thioflexithrix psekupsensis]